MAPLNVLEEAILKMPVVCEGKDELDACFTGIIDDLVQALESNFVVYTCDDEHALNVCSEKHMNT